MLHFPRAIAVTISLVIGWALSLPSHAFRCKTKLVVEGYTTGQVINRCGKPAIREEIVVEHIRRYHDGFEASNYITKEFWVYGASSSRFIRILTFEDDELVKIETGGYGGHIAKRVNCIEPKGAIEQGDNIALVAYLCGEPTRARLVGRIKGRYFYRGYNFANQIIEEWDYFQKGSNRKRVYRFRDGILDSIRDEDIY
ncbi:DUF2845 domain-containing protein [Spartinivicinus poritis]|uniref:DUF2845 domain-containing protein n=1 Tax=Spartinivicinus poritis TaxID=2994640 RepID=A0ABT5U6P5_9GAMM|nr:DUF2845 domain-containing protein [Spartinivicinus sp. A2-2]MDE1461865.1 DUF2845 domain-containing protein [Spartinivicinus sp. A2-2]